MKVADLPCSSWCKREKTELAAKEWPEMNDDAARRSEVITDQRKSRTLGLDRQCSIQGDVQPQAASSPEAHHVKMGPPVVLARA
jgi:hypothetical protein